MGIFDDSMFTPNMGTQFEAPYEGMYMQGPGWAQNSAYMSPAYSANFRPPYGGPVGFNANNIPNFSLTGALNTSIPSPFQSDVPYYTNPLAYRGAALTQATTLPADAGMWGIQNIAAPLAGYAVGRQVFGATMPGTMFGRKTPMTQAQQATGAMAGRMSMIKPWFQTNVTGTMTAAEYSAARAAATTRVATQSFGAFLGGQTGRFAGAGAGRLAGGAIGGAIGTAGRLTGTGTIGGGAAMGARIGGTALGGALGATGAALGSMFLPFMAATAAANVTQSMIIDPYIASRRGAQAATANLSSMYTGTNMVGGRGLSRSMANQVSGALIGAGVDDRSFGLEGGINMFDMAMTSGLIDNIGTVDPENIKKQVKTVSKQVQALMAVAGDPDVRRAVERLAEMKRMGISGADAQTTIQALGMAESLTGKSAVQLQNTVGRQASFLFQQAGITGQGAQEAAASALSGFTNAYKMGLINPTQLALMGGTEGATQSLLAGQIGGARSLYNRIGLANRFMYGNQQQGVVNNVNAFGNQVAGNPLAAFGALQMNSAAMIGAQLQENPLAPGEQIFDMLRTSVPAEQRLGKGGKTRWDVFAGAGLQLNFQEDQIRAMLEMKRGLQAPGAQGRMRAAQAASVREQYSAFLERENLGWTQGWMGGAAMGFHELGIGYGRIKGNIGESFSELNTVMGRASDVLEKGLVGKDAGDPRYFDESNMKEFLLTGKTSISRYRALGKDESIGPIEGIFRKFTKRGEVNDRISAAINNRRVTRQRFQEIMKLPKGDRIAALRTELDLSTEDAINASSAEVSIIPDVNTAEVIKSNDFKIALNKLVLSGRRETEIYDDIQNLGFGEAQRAFNEKYKGKDFIGDMSFGEQLKLASTADKFYGEGGLDYAISLTQTVGLSKKQLANNEAALKDISLLTGLTVDDIKNNPEKLEKILATEAKTRKMGDTIAQTLTGEGTIYSQLIQEARERGEDLEAPGAIDKIAAGATSKMSAAAALGISSAKVATKAEYDKLNTITKDAITYQERLDKMFKSGQLDFTGYMEAGSANKMDLAAEKMNQAADKMLKANGVSAPEQVSESGENSWFPF